MSEAHYAAAVVDSADDAIVCSDRRGCITLWNRAAGRVLGYTAAEIIGRDISLLFAAEGRVEEAAAYARIASGESGVCFNAIFVAKDGRRLGFDGKSLIHPNQIAPCHHAFAPSPAEVERAKALVEAFRGGAERFGNEMIERMHVEAAQRVLERAGG